MRGINIANLKIDASTFQGKQISKFLIQADNAHLSDIVEDWNDLPRGQNRVYDVFGTDFNLKNAPDRTKVYWYGTLLELWGSLSYFGFDIYVPDGSGGKYAMALRARTRGTGGIDVNNSPWVYVPREALDGESKEIQTAESHNFVGGGGIKPYVLAFYRSAEKGGQHERHKYCGSNAGSHFSEQRSDIWKHSLSREYRRIKDSRKIHHLRRNNRDIPGRLSPFRSDRCNNSRLDGSISYFEVTGKYIHKNDKQNREYVRVANYVVVRREVVAA